MDEGTPAESSAQPSKRPKNSFLLFSADERARLQAEDPAALKDPNLVHVIAAKWRAAPKEAKETYVARAKALYAEFKQGNPEYRYKMAKKSRKKKSIKVPNLEQDSLQMLNHLFQSNPFLLQQIVENRDKSGRPNMYQCIFPK